MHENAFLHNSKQQALEGAEYLAGQNKAWACRALDQHRQGRTGLQRQGMCSKSILVNFQASSVILFRAPLCPGTLSLVQALLCGFLGGKRQTSWAHLVDRVTAMLHHR